VRFVVPDAPPAPRAPISFAVLLRDPELVRLNVGIFALHAVLMALFVVVPVALARAGLPAGEHWWVYLTAVLAGFVLMMPAVVGRHAARDKPVFLLSIAAVAVSIAMLAAWLDSVSGIVAGLVIFFGGFNVLEAKLPALVSRAAPREATGSATGVYSSVQFLGTFVGAAAGGALAQHVGFLAVLGACLAVMLGWLAVARGMGDFVPRPSPAARP
jgi:predicted MFS family arabinose efflux permease